jgi:hypothetical protein
VEQQRVASATWIDVGETTTTTLRGDGDGDGGDHRPPPLSGSATEIVASTTRHLPRSGSGIGSVAETTRRRHCGARNAPCGPCGRRRRAQCGSSTWNADGTLDRHRCGSSTWIVVANRRPSGWTWSAGYGAWASACPSCVLAPSFPLPWRRWLLDKNLGQSERREPDRTVQIVGDENATGETVDRLSQTSSWRLASMVAVPHNDRIGYALVKKVIVLGSCVPKTGHFGLRANGPRNGAPLFGIWIRICCSSEVMTL